MSAAVEEAEAANSSTATKTKDGFVVPSLPPHLGSTSTTPSYTASTSTLAPPKRPIMAPKTIFPDIHLPVLFRRIDALATSNLAFIVETLHQELREHKVKKNSIEAKIREVAEKCKERKVWVVKPEAKSNLCSIPSQAEPISFLPEVL